MNTPFPATHPDVPSLLGPLFAGGGMRARFGDRVRIQAMLDFEAALARAVAEVGLIPAQAVAPIAACCQAEQYELGALAAATARAGNPAIPLVKALTACVAERDADAARYVHWGATSQDVIDTATVLQLRGALAQLDALLARLGRALAELARTHRASAMAGRTFLQHAVPVTLGLKAAGYLSALGRDRARLAAATERALCLQLGGAAGTLSAFGDQGLRVAAALARELSLSLPDLPWHTQRDRIAEVGTVVGLATGSLGKLARDLSLLMQSEIAEVREPAGEGRGGSSTMPHKQNPVGCTVALAAAIRAPGLVATLLTAMPQEHERGLGGWHAEWEALPTLLELAAGAAETLAEVVEGLEVDTGRMRAQLDAGGGEIYAERVSMALAETLGKQAAHELVEACSREARARGEPFAATLRASEAVRAVLDEAALARLLSPEQALGMTLQLIERALDRAEKDHT